MHKYLYIQLEEERGDYYGVFGVHFDLELRALECLDENLHPSPSDLIPLRSGVSDQRRPPAMRHTVLCKVQKRDGMEQRNNRSTGHCVRERNNEIYAGFIYSSWSVISWGNLVFYSEKEPIKMRHVRTTPCYQKSYSLLLAHSYVIF